MEELREFEMTKGVGTRVFFYMQHAAMVNWSSVTYQIKQSWHVCPLLGENASLIPIQNGIFITQTINFRD